MLSREQMVASAVRWPACLKQANGRGLENSRLSLHDVLADRFHF